MSPLLTTIHNRFNIILLEEAESLLTPYPAFRQPVLNAITKGGKQIRPLLYLESIYIWSGKEPTKEDYKIAAAIELLHVFYLIHDDLMDGDEIRRESPTLHCAFEDKDSSTGKALALIFGDIIFSKAIELVSQHPDFQIRTSLLVLFFEVNNKTAEGQIRECDHSFIPTTDTIIDFYTLKTAYYSIYLPLASASIVCKKGEEHLQSLLAMSKHLGIAYQLYDDVLELIGEKKRRNTDHSGDLLRLKMTPILTQYLSTLPNEECNFYQLKYTHCEELTPNEEEVLRNAILNSSILQDMKTLITNHLEESKQSLPQTSLTESTIIASLHNKYKTF